MYPVPEFDILQLLFHDFFLNVHMRKLSSWKMSSFSEWKWGFNTNRIQLPVCHAQVCLQSPNRLEKGLCLLSRYVYLNYMPGQSFLNVFRLLRSRPPGNKPIALVSVHISADSTRNIGRCVQRQARGNIILFSQSKHLVDGNDTREY